MLLLNEMKYAWDINRSSPKQFKLFIIIVMLIQQYYKSEIALTIINYLDNIKVLMIKNIQTQRITVNQKSNLVQVIY